MMEVADSQAGQVKLYIELHDGGWHGSSSESVWVERTAVFFYRIMNIPFYAKGISFLDVVEGRLRDGKLWYARTVRFSGHSTYRILVSRDAKMEELQSAWLPLEQLGCRYEENLTLELRMWAIDVPPEADIHRVFDNLELGERRGVWSFEEGHCGHPL